MLPFFEVSHLPASASFFSAVLQPLGLVYLLPTHGNNDVTHATPRTSSSPSAPALLGSLEAQSMVITYGTASPPTPVLRLREVREPKRSHAVYSAPSPTAVAECYEFALRASPVDPVALGLSPALRPSPQPNASGETRCRITDLDGNTMDVVYVPTWHYSGQYAGSTIGPRKMQSTADEAGRILDWNYDVASPGLESPPAGAGGPEPSTILHRSVTTSTIEQSACDSPSAHASGASASTIVGALLGAAAGAALTYGIMRNERDRAPRQDFAPPPVARRATFPFNFPMPGPQPTAPGGSGRYVEVERTVEKIRYPQYNPPVADHRLPPPHLAKYSQAGISRTRAIENMDNDNRSQYSSRSKARSSAGPATRSTVSQTPRGPLMLMDHEHRSNAGSTHSVSKPPTVRAQSYEPTDRDTYVSARSQRSASTIRGPPPPTVETELAVRSGPPSSAPSTRAPIKEPTIIAIGESGTSMTPSRVASKAHSKIGAGSMVSIAGVGGSANGPPYTFSPNTSPPSHVSARHIGLPMSGVGSSHAGWDNDNFSIAPSDSISCVGSKASRRRYSPRELAADDH